jgi:hypothetical protein
LLVLFSLFSLLIYTQKRDKKEREKEKFVPLLFE